jgi:hypothetical protein
MFAIELDERGLIRHHKDISAFWTFPLFSGVRVIHTHGLVAVWAGKLNHLVGSSSTKDSSQYP